MAQELMEKEKEILIDFKCLICGNSSGNKKYKVKEMQFGMRDEFIYCECSSCGCLQLVNPPENISKYYPQNYFAFGFVKGSFLKEKLNSCRDNYLMGGNSLIGRVLSFKLDEPTYIKWMKSAGVNLNSKILDVGCGAGKLLYRMGNAGFKELTGIDMFIDKNIKYENGVKIFKESLFNINDRYDLIMLHHSLEHMEDQHKVFKHLTKIVKKGKILLIRIPVCSSRAWKIYRENWFALEAPRHYFNHTEKSILMLAEQYGFREKYISYDSRSIQFWGSEQYKKDIPLMDESSYFINPGNSVFSKEEIDEFEKETVKVNESGEGDQIVLFLVKVR